MTPSETAKNEAARQAVALGFAVAGCAILIIMQRKMGGGILGMVQAEADAADPSGAARRRMEASKRASERWHKTTVWLWRFGPWRAAREAHRRAQAAAEAYERERM